MSLVELKKLKSQMEAQNKKDGLEYEKKIRSIDYHSKEIEKLKIKIAEKEKNPHYNSDGKTLNGNYARQLGSLKQDMKLNIDAKQKYEYEAPILNNKILKQNQEIIKIMEDIEEAGEKDKYTITTRDRDKLRGDISDFKDERSKILKKNEKFPLTERKKEDEIDKIKMNRDDELKKIEEHIKKLKISLDALTDTDPEYEKIEKEILKNEEEKKKISEQSEQDIKKIEAEIVEIRTLDSFAITDATHPDKITEPIKNSRDEFVKKLASGKNAEELREIANNTLHKKSAEKLYGYANEYNDMGKGVGNIDKKVVDSNIKTDSQFKAEVNQTLTKYRNKYDIKFNGGFNNNKLSVPQFNDKFKRTFVNI